jgi:hypothetical protein
MTPLPPPANLTIVGDVHRQWRAVDGDYLERVKPDLAMFVGDLGDEDPGIVAEIAALRVSKAVILAHNGPLGLSEEPRDIYGKDFGQRPGGDWGDRDLQLALQRIAEMGRRVRMVVAGHMHHELVHPRGDLRVRFCKCAGTTFVNPAVVPRVREASDRGAESYFVRTYWSRGMCLAIEEVWVDERGQERSATTPRVVELEPRALQDVGEDSKD